MWWIIHIVVFLVFMPGLILTIPLHMIDRSIRKGR